MAAAACAKQTWSSSGQRHFRRNLVFQQFDSGLDFAWRCSSAGSETKHLANNMVGRDATMRPCHSSGTPAVNTTFLIYFLRHCYAESSEAAKGPTKVWRPCLSSCPAALAEFIRAFCVRVNRLIIPACNANYLVNISRTYFQLAVRAVIACA